MIKPDPKVKTLWNCVNNFLMFLVLLAAVVLILGGMEVGIAIFLGALWVIVLYIPIALFIPASFRRLEYSLDDDAIRLKKGVFWRRVTTVPYAKITNIDITQGPLERLFHVSKLHIQTAGFSGNQATHAELMMIGICDAEDLKEHIMSKIRNKALPPEAAAVTVKTDTQLLQAILEELSSIHSVLSKK